MTDEQRAAEERLERAMEGLAKAKDEAKDEVTRAQLAAMIANNNEWIEVARMMRRTMPDPERQLAELIAELIRGASHPIAHVRGRIVVTPRLLELVPGLAEAMPRSTDEPPNGPHGGY
jgi:hypothetical protein